MSTLNVTDKIELTPISLKDADDIFRTIDRERRHLGEWLPFVARILTKEDSVDFIQSITTAQKGPADLVYVIRYEGKFVGLIRYKFTDPANRKTELRYWVSERYQGMGIVTLSARALINQAFYDWDFHRIQICTAVGNERGKRIPKRLGFAFEGIAREAEFLATGFTDIEVYALLRPGWKYSP